MSLLERDPQLANASRNDVHDVLYGTMDYVRRIHWWVRLAGIIWIVIPIVLTVLAVFFMIGAAANSSSGSY